MEYSLFNGELFDEDDEMEYTFIQSKKEKKMEYHKVHCPRCGKVIRANELAFDLGEVINIALEKAKNRTFGKNEEWYDLTRYNLCLYLNLDDLVKQYGLTSNPNNTYSSYFKFTVKHLSEQLIALAASMNPSFDLDALMSDTNIVEYNALTNAMAKSSESDKQELAEEIQQLAALLKKTPDETVIVSFNLTVYMSEDDRGNRFANRLLVEFDDRAKKNITRFVCKGEKGYPCGKILYGQAGLFEEIIIGMAGTARVGKTAYLAALLASIQRKGERGEQLGYDQNIIANIAFMDEAYVAFEHDLLEPYVKSEKITKTPYLFDEASKGKEAVSLFSMTFNINRGKSYIFTFIDMPGEVFDDDRDEGINRIDNNRRIIKQADIIWVCISVEQVIEEAQAGPEQINTDWRKAVMNLGRTMQAINCTGKIPTAVLITKSDILDSDSYKLYYKDFNPFAGNNNEMRYLEEKGRKTPWVNEQGALYYSNMEWFLKNTLDFIESAHGLTQSICNIFGKFTPFAVAPYGKNIDHVFMDNTTGSSLPQPSMIEGPFLWTLGLLGILRVFKEKAVLEEHEERSLFFRRTVTTEVTRNVEIDESHRDELYYYKP